MKLSSFLSGFSKIFQNPHGKSLKKAFFFGTPVFLFFLLLIVFFITRGPVPPASEITYSEYSPYGKEAGSIVPASCNSADPMYPLWWDATAGTWRNSGSHFRGDCVTTCPSGIGMYDPYYDPSATGCCSASFGTGCWSAPNACGAQGWGTINCAGACTGVTPANPGWLGVGCWSAPNACGAQGWGTINCAGACTGVTPPNPWYLGNACSVANVCGISNSGTLLCSGACSVGAPALPAGYGTACTSAANNCGSTNPGAIDCSGGCNAVTPANIPLGNACSGPANACGMTIPGTITCAGCNSTVAPSNALCDLAVCKSSCSSHIDKTGNFPVDSGTSTTLKACFYQTGTSACASGVDVTGSATWTETNAPKDAIYFSSTGILNSRYVNGDEVFNVSYLGVSKSPQVTVTCIPNTCSIAPAKTVTDTYCPEVTQDTGIPTGCDGMTLICPGTRKCNYNWREIAP